MNAAPSLAIPAYFHPCERPDDWHRLWAADAGTISIVVANILDGPGHVREQHWADAFASTCARGVDLIGYVDTGYLGTTGQITRLGSKAAEDWIAQIQHDVSHWYLLYGPELGGIFFDQMPTNAGDDSSPLDIGATGRGLTSWVRRHDADGVTVLNPGTAVPACLAGAADVIVTFEGLYEHYIRQVVDTIDGGRRAAGDHRVWHIVYGVDTDDRRAEVVSLAAMRGIDHLYLTEARGSNPFGSLALALEALTCRDGGGSCTAVPDHSRVALGARNDRHRSDLHPPCELAAVATGHTSIRVTWDFPSPDRRCGVLRRAREHGDARDDVEFDVLSGATVIARLPAWARSVEIGGLLPGSVQTISMRSASQMGGCSRPADPVVVTVPGLRGDGRAITAPDVRWRDGMIEPAAQFLVPFAVHRVFLAPAGSPHDGMPRWTTGSSPQIEARWMVEDGGLFEYVGSGTDWAWQYRGPVPRRGGNVCRSWSLDPGRIGRPGTLDLVFQAEGHASSVHSDVIRWSGREQAVDDVG